MALTAAGVPAEDVKLVVVSDTIANEYHAITAVRLDGVWLTLDNRCVPDDELRHAIPLFVLDENGVRQFTSPETIAATPQSPAPASFQRR